MRYTLVEAPAAGLDLPRGRLQRFNFRPPAAMTIYEFAPCVSVCVAANYRTAVTHIHSVPRLRLPRAFSLSLIIGDFMPMRVIRSAGICRLDWKRRSIGIENFICNNVPSRCEIFIPRERLSRKTSINIGMVKKCQRARTRL